MPLTRLAILPLATVMLIRDPLSIAALSSSAEHRRRLRQRLNISRARGDELDRRYLTRWELEIGDRIFRGVMRTSDWPARVAQRIVRHVPDAWRGRPHERELRDYVVDLVRRGSSRTGAPAEPERWTSIFRRLHDLAANDHLRSLAPAEARMYVEG